MVLIVSDGHGAFVVCVECVDCVDCVECAECVDCVEWVECVECAKRVECVESVDCVVCVDFIFSDAECVKRVECVESVDCVDLMFSVAESVELVFSLIYNAKKTTDRINSSTNRMKKTKRTLEGFRVSGSSNKPKETRAIPVYFLKRVAVLEKKS